jgi:hypothetical protein
MVINEWIVNPWGFLPYLSPCPKRLHAQPSS